MSTPQTAGGRPSRLLHRGTTVTHEHKRTTALAVVALLAAGLLPGCVGFSPLVWVESQEHLELSATELDALAVVTHNGRVEVGPAKGASDQITVEVTKRAGGLTLGDAQACMDALVITTDKEGSTQKLGWEYEGIRHASWGAQVSFEITMPPELTLKAKSHNGRIEASGLNGDCDLETHNGRIEARTTSKRFYAETHNGRINVTAAPVEIHLLSHNGGITAELDCPGDLSGVITTHNGGISVQLGERAKTNLTCRTHNGRVRYHGTMSELTASRTRLSGRIGESDATLEIVTHNGSIDVR